jgi:hypothetical protein
LTPSLTRRARFAIDEAALFATGTAGVVSVVPKEDTTESLEYLLAILNSTLLTYYAVAHSPTFRGGYYKFSKAYIADLPVRRIDPQKPAEMAIHDELSRLAIERMKVEERRDTAKTPLAELQRVRKAFVLEKAIDEIVYSLYGITPAEAEGIIASERNRFTRNYKRHVEPSFASDQMDGDDGDAEP